MFQSAFHGNAKKEAGNVTNYSEINEISYLGVTREKNVSVSLFVGTAVIFSAHFCIFPCRKFYTAIIMERLAMKL